MSVPVPRLLPPAARWRKHGTRRLLPVRPALLHSAVGDIFGPAIWLAWPSNALRRRGFSCMSPAAIIRARNDATFMIHKLLLRMKAGIVPTRFVVVLRKVYFGRASERAKLLARGKRAHKPGWHGDCFRKLRAFLFTHPHKQWLV